MKIADLLKRCQWVAQQGGLSPPFHCVRGAMCCGCIFDQQVDALSPCELCGEDPTFIADVVNARARLIGGASLEAVTAEEAVNFFERLKLCQN